MKVQGINVVRVAGGKVNVPATIASYVAAYEEKAKKDYTDFVEALNQKLSGAKDHSDVLADALNAFFERRRAPGVRLTVQRSLVVDQVAGSLAGKEPFQDLSYNQMKATVEDFIRDNASTPEAPDESAWFSITTGKGRTQGTMTEQNPPTLGGMVAATPEEIAAETSAVAS